jgi:hypothetical protein
MYVQFTNFKLIYLYMFCCKIMNRIQNENNHNEPHRRPLLHICTDINILIEIEYFTWVSELFRKCASFFVFHFITIFSNLIRWNGILFIISCNIQGPDTPGFWWGLCCSCFYFSVLNFVLFVIVLCLVYLLLSVSLDCQFFMVLSGFSDDYLLKVSY